jgi:hypothetical protein
LVTGRSTIDDRYIAYLSRKERLKSHVDYYSFSVYNILYLEKPQSMHLDVFFVSIYDIIRMDHDVQ